MLRNLRGAFALAALLLIYLINPAVAWLMVAAMFAYVIGKRRRRSLSGISLN